VVYSANSMSQPKPHGTADHPVATAGLRIVVLVKQVPDTANVTGDAMKEDGTVNRAALPAVFKPRGPERA